MYMSAPSAQATAEAALAGEQSFLSFRVGSQLFGLPLLTVRDVLDARHLTRIPLAPPEIAGALNLRGRIITAIDVRCRMRMPARPVDGSYMSIVVDYQDELYNLIVDAVGDVLSLSRDVFEANPSTLDPAWREFSDGIYRLDGELMLVVDVARLLTFAC